MTYDWQIESGDRVAVYFDHTGNGPAFEGKVRNVPGQMFESWIIEDDKGQSHYVQTYAQIVRVGLVDRERVWP